MTKIRMIGLGLVAIMMLAGTLGVPTKTSAQDSKPGVFKEDMTKLVESTRQLAKSLTERHAVILDALKRATTADEANKSLQDMVDFANSTAALFSDDNEIWKGTAELLQVAEARIKYAQNMINTDARWTESLKDWQRIRDQLQQVRTDLLKHRDSASAALKKVNADRDLISDYLHRDLVKRAIAELQKAAEEMGVMAGGLQSILDLLQKVTPGA